MATDNQLFIYSADTLKPEAILEDFAHKTCLSIEVLGQDKSPDGLFNISKFSISTLLDENLRLISLQYLLPYVRAKGYACYLRQTDAERIQRIVADLDGTLTKHELLIELSRGKPWEEEMTRLTEETMSGMHSFEASFAKRMRHLEGITASEIEQLGQDIPLALGAELLPYFIQGESLRLDIASSNIAPYVHSLAIRLGANRYLASIPQLAEDDETLTGHLIEPIVASEHKRAFVLEDPDSKASAMATLALGDGANDLGMLSVAGHALLYSALHPESPNLAHIIASIYFS